MRLDTFSHMQHFSCNHKNLINKQGLNKGTLEEQEQSFLSEFDSRDELDCAARFKIIFGITKRLLCLRENCQRRLIRRDIKADNILLTVDFVPQKEGVLLYFTNGHARSYIYIRATRSTVEFTPEIFYR